MEHEGNMEQINSQKCHSLGIRSLDVVKKNLPQVQQFIKDLNESEIHFEVLLQSKIGRSLKFFCDFCHVYKSDLRELERLEFLASSILLKWKTYVLNLLFDEQHEYDKTFIKSKRSRPSGRPRSLLN